MARGRQWRTSLSGLLGLDYGVLDKVAGWIGVTVTDVVFDFVQELQDEFLRLTDEESKAEEEKRKRNRRA